MCGKVLRRNLLQIHEGRNMATILHLEKNPEVRKTVKELLTKAGHEVIGVDSVDEAQVLKKVFDLFICAGDIDKHFDGLLFALDRAHEKARILILAETHKFKRIAFFPINSLGKRGAEFVRTCEEAIQGGT
jgi:hypothetical protein